MALERGALGQVGSVEKKRLWESPKQVAIGQAFP